MDLWISLAVNVLIEALIDRKNLVKHVDKMAKVYIKIKTAAESNPTLAAAIQRQIERG